jgi:hypothetical protein
VISGSISILIGLLVIPYIRKIKSYLPSLIVACNMVFGATALEIGIVGSIFLKTDKITNQTFDLNFNIAAYFFLLGCSPIIFVAFTYLYNTFKIMYPNKAKYAIITFWFIFICFYVTLLLLFIRIGVYFYKQPFSIKEIVDGWIDGHNFSFPKFMHWSSIYTIVLFAVLWVIVTIALLVSLVLIYKFNKHAQMDQDGKFNYLMLAYHLCWNLLYFSCTISLLNVLVRFT